MGFEFEKWSFFNLLIEKRMPCHIFSWWFCASGANPIFEKAKQRSLPVKFRPDGSCKAGHQRLGSYVIDRYEEFLRLPLPPAQPLLVTVEGEAFDVLPVGLESVLPRVKVANPALPLDLAAAPEEHGPVGVVPALKCFATRLLENFPESCWQLGIALA